MIDLRPARVRWGKYPRYAKFGFCLIWILTIVAFLVLIFFPDYPSKVADLFEYIQNLSPVGNVILITVASFGSHKLWSKWVGRDQYLKTDFADTENDINGVFYPYVVEENGLNRSEAKSLYESLKGLNDSQYRRLAESEFMLVTQSLRSVFEELISGNASIINMYGSARAGRTTALIYLASRLALRPSTDVYQMREEMLDTDKFITALKATIHYMSRSSRNELYVLCDQFNMNNDSTIMALEAAHKLLSKHTELRVRMLVVGNGPSSSKYYEDMKLIISPQDLPILVEKLNSVFKRDISAAQLAARMPTPSGEEWTIPKTIHTYQLLIQS